MVTAANLGFPRIGAKRELKKAMEGYWKKELSKDQLLNEGKALRLRHWQMQKEAGIAHIPCNDFSFYDQMLDMSCLLGCVPSRYNWKGGNVDLDTYFAMARGSDKVTAMEMTKWFDTNYHYLVPEFEKSQSFALSSTKVFDEFEEAKKAGIETPRPVLIGPVTYLKSGKTNGEFCRCTLVENILPVYEQVLQKLESMGAQWVQIDEPCLTLDLEDRYKDAFKTVYARLAKAAPKIKIMLATYFEGLRDNMQLAFGLPVAGVHIDLCRAPDQLEPCLAALPKDKVLSLGLIDGRNIWKNDLEASLRKIEQAAAKAGKDRIMVAGSCSLLHTPIDLAFETALDADIKGWMAYARQKLDEIAALAKAADGGRNAAADAFDSSAKAVAERKSSKRIHDEAVKKRMAGLTPDMSRRRSPFKARQQAQRDALGLPLYPTTTIGSFPQTSEVREARASFKRGDIDEAAYEAAMEKEIRKVVDYQEKTGIDVLVHGEPERNDMVEYFGEQLSGFTFSKNGWVQSYGSRCVKPPIIYGDVSRPAAMTVRWSEYAQSLTKKPMKGMLTGPITILQWSFVRDDQPRSDTCRQIALAIRDEVSDLEKAGITVIQIDEPAIREGLPLRRADWKAYLEWAVDAFRLCSCSVVDSTQIHTHMCYSEFNDIIDSIAALDADVISIESSRSKMDLLDSFVTFKYPNEIGPGVYDIHSPRVPATQEMVELLEKAAAVIDPQLLWVNPDCGLKTRGWKEVEPALKNMAEAAQIMRKKVRSAAA